MAAASRRGAGGGFGFDPVLAVRHLRRSDARLASLIDAVGPFRMELQGAQSAFEALAEAIVYQQLSGRAAATIYGRVCALFPRDRPSAAQLLATSDAALRGAGLSRAKTLALQDLAHRVEAGEVPPLGRLRRMEDDAVVESLTRVRGIGRWTAEMFLMFRLGRPDVLPVDDYGLRKGFAVAFGKRKLPAPAAVARHGERWRPYRSVASWYLWRALERAAP